MHYFNYALPTLTLLIGFTLSAIAGYYSVLGLSTIFGGAMIGFIFMEIAKVSCTMLLHKHWNDGFGIIKYVLSLAVIILLLITSMGTFGYLSKASSARSSDVSINSSKMVYLEENILRENTKLKQNQLQIDSYNVAISRLITDNPARASVERRRLQNDVSLLVKENKVISSTIDTISKELVPYKVEISKHEVEIGPLIYITKLIYGEEYVKHSVEVLSYLIIIIVLVFDPLAIMLLIASQKSFGIISRKNNLKVKKEDIKVNVDEEQIVVDIEPEDEVEILEDIPQENVVRTKRRANQM